MARKFTPIEKRILTAQRAALTKVWAWAEEDPTLYCACGREADGHFKGRFLCDECAGEEQLIENENNNRNGD